MFLSLIHIAESKNGISMYRLICIATLLFTSVSLAAQGGFEFAPVGAEWDYRISNWRGEVTGYELVHSDRDTTIQGKTCKVLERISSRGGYPLSSIIICQTGAIIEHWVEEEFYTLYDFSARVGDSWTIKLLDYDFQSQFRDGVASLHVDWRETEPVCEQVNVRMGVSLKFDQGFDGSQYLVGWGISEINSKLGSINFIIPRIAYDYPDSWRLNCYTDEACEYKNPALTTECEQLVNSINLIESETVNIYPSPTSDFLYLSTSTKYRTVEIYNMQGKLVKVFPTLTNEAILDVSTLKNGIYLLRAIDEGGNSFSELFIVLK